MRTERHRLLARQLRRLGIDPDPGGDPPSAAQWQAFLGRVDLAYTETDRARALLERALELSTREMGERLDDQRRHDELRLLVRHRRLTSMFEHVPVPLLALDERDRVVAANPAAAAVHGPARALIGMPIDGVLCAEVLAASTVVALPEDDDPLSSIVIVAEVHDRELVGDLR